jgi:hypothetical protein
LGDSAPSVLLVHEVTTLKAAKTAGHKKAYRLRDNKRLLIISCIGFLFMDFFDSLFNYIDTTFPRSVASESNFSKVFWIKTSLYGKKNPKGNTHPPGQI